MRVFARFNGSHGEVCPICGTAESKPTVLVGIQGTENNGIMEAKQYHVDCIELRERQSEDKSIFWISMGFAPKLPSVSDNQSPTKV